MSLPFLIGFQLYIILYIIIYYISIFVCLYDVWTDHIWLLHQMEWCGWVGEKLCCYNSDFSGYLS